MRKLGLIALTLLPVVGFCIAAPRLLGHAMFALGYRIAAAPLIGDAGWRGYALAHAGAYRSAVEAFGDAPANAYNRGNALTRSGLYHQALDAYDAALDADPEDADARYNKAIVEKILDTEATAAGDTTGKANASSRTERRHGGAGNEKGDTNSVGIGFVGNKEASSDSGAQGGNRVSKVGKGQTQDSGNNSDKASGSAGQSSGRGRSGGDLADGSQQLALNLRRYAPAYTTKSINADVQWLQTVPDDPGSFLKLQIRAEHKRREAIAARSAGED